MSGQGETKHIKCGWRVGSPNQVFLQEWRSIVAEFLGTLFYVLIVTGASSLTLGIEFL